MTLLSWISHSQKFFGSSVDTPRFRGQGANASSRVRLRRYLAMNYEPLTKNPDAFTSLN